MMRHGLSLSQWDLIRGVILQYMVFGCFLWLVIVSYRVYCRVNLNSWVTLEINNECASQSNINQ